MERLLSLFVVRETPHPTHGTAKQDGEGVTVFGECPRLSCLVMGVILFGDSCVWWLTLGVVCGSILGSASSVVEGLEIRRRA